MKTEISLESIKGKTIDNMTWGNDYMSSQVVIVFTDDSFITLCVEHNYDLDDLQIVSEKLDPLTFGDKKLIQSGVVDQDEMIALRQEYEKKRKLQREANERRTFEILKQKYEPKS